MNEQQRVVLDTNCLLMAIPRRSHYHQILLDFLSGRYFLCVSNEVILEYEEVLTRKLGKVVAANVINAILAAPNTLYIYPCHRYHLIESDPDDNKFVDCAITAKAKFIVTQDRHYDALRFNPKYDFSAVDIDYFLNRLNNHTISNL